MKTRNESPNPVKLILLVCGISLVATVLFALAAGVKFWFPPQASTVAADVDNVFNFITWICVFFFVLIVIMMVYFCVKYRRIGHSKATSDVTHNTPLELTWTIIPLILVIGIFYVGMMGYLNLRRPPAGSYEVQVMAGRWSWNFKHRNGLSEANVLLVPVGRPVKLVMESTDVLHAAFIPEFRVKQDIVPGRVTYLWFECTKAGTYDLFCAEYCGRDHSQMHALVQAVDEATFQVELEKRSRWFEGIAEEQLYTFAREKIYPRCASCHALDGSTVNAPSWRGLWKTLEESPQNKIFTDGTNLSDAMGPGKQFENPEDYIQQSILNPHQKIVMNYNSAMPTFKGQLKQQELVAIREFIKHIDEFDEKGNPKPGSDAARIAEEVKNQAGKEPVNKPTDVPAGAEGAGER